MDHRAQVEAYIDDLKQRGVDRYTSAPPLFRLLWNMGLQVRPPLFLPFLANAIIMGVPFGVLFGAIDWSGWMHQSDASIWSSLARLVSVSVMFGLMMAAYYRWKRHILDLPSWRDYCLREIPPHAAAGTSGR